MSGDAVQTFKMLQFSWPLYMKWPTFCCSSLKGAIHWSYSWSSVYLSQDTLFNLCKQLYNILSYVALERLCQVWGNNPCDVIRVISYCYVTAHMLFTTEICFLTLEKNKIFVILELDPLGIKSQDISAFISCLIFLCNTIYWFATVPLNVVPKMLCMQK